MGGLGRPAHIGAASNDVLERGHALAPPRLISHRRPARPCPRRVQYGLCAGPISLLKAMASKLPGVKGTEVGRAGQQRGHMADGRHAAPAARRGMCL